MAQERKKMSTPARIGTSAVGLGLVGYGMHGLHRDYGKKGLAIGGGAAALGAGTALYLGHRQRHSQPKPMTHAKTGKYGSRAESKTRSFTGVKR